MRVIWLWHLSLHWSPGLIRLIWLARRASLPTSPLHVHHSRSCTLGWRGRPSPIEDCSSVRGIRLSVLPCWNLQTSSQSDWWELRCWTLGPGFLTHDATCWAQGLHLRPSHHFMGLGGMRSRAIMLMSLLFAVLRFNLATLICAEDYSGTYGCHLWMVPTPGIQRLAFFPNEDRIRQDKIFILVMNIIPAF